MLARQRALLRLAWLLVGDWGTAEDLVQSALIRAWSRWPRIRAVEDVDAYVRRILVNTGADWHRGGKKRETPTEPLPEVAAPAAMVDTETRQALLTAILQLPPRQRATVALRYLEDQSEEQTAWLLGCSVGTVKSQLSKALRALRAESALAGLSFKES